MSKVDYAWHSSKPPAPDVYVTRRNSAKYLSLRYWDGATWWSVEYGGRRGGKPFTWPKNSRTRKPTWRAWYGKHTGWAIRKIDVRLGDIQWGTPFKVYDQKEVLSYLVSTGRLPEDWKTCYQEEMRKANLK